MALTLPGRPVARWEDALGFFCDEERFSKSRELDCIRNGIFVRGDIEEVQVRVLVVFW